MQDRVIFAERLYNTTAPVCYNGRLVLERQIVDLFRGTVSQPVAETNPSHRSSDRDPIPFYREGQCTVIATLSPDRNGNRYISPPWNVSMTQGSASSPSVVATALEADRTIHLMIGRV